MSTRFALIFCKGITHSVKKASLIDAFFIVCITCTLLINSACQAQHDGELRKVRAVIDGDTIMLENKELVRMIGINSPEKGRDGDADEPFALEARLLLQELIGSDGVRIFPGEQDRDIYGRLLATVKLKDGRDPQEIILRKGYASVVAIPPNIIFVDKYLAAQAEAKKTQRGIWGRKYFHATQAHSLTKNNTGFHFVEGRVKEVTTSKKNIYLQLTQDFSLTIPKENWKRYWDGEFRSLKDKQVSVSGWITKSAHGLRLKVHHPAMFNLADG